MQALIDGLSVRLKELAPEAAIYQNDVEQGLQRPCFFIIPLVTSMRVLPMGRSEIRMPLQLTYLAPKDGDNAALLRVAECLLYGLRTLPLKNGDMIRGWDLSFEIIDDALQFSGNFNYFNRTIDPDEESMDTLISVEGRVV